MKWIWEGIQQAFTLISQADPEVLEITFLSEDFWVCDYFELVDWPSPWNFASNWPIRYQKILDFVNKHRYGVATRCCWLDGFHLFMAKWSAG